MHGRSMDGGKHRVLLFNRFNIARNYYFGVLIIIGIPLGTLLCIRFIILSSVMLDRVSYGTLFLVTHSCILFSFLSEVAMICLFICDPGVVSEADDEEVHQCPVCRCYVRDYDHHCDIIGACIGGRNMGFFISFLTLISALMWVVFAAGCAVLFFSVKETLLQFSFHGMLEVVLKKEWWLLSYLRPLTLLVVIGLGYCSIFTTFLAVYYWIVTCRGKYSLKRRRNSWMGGAVGDVFRQMWVAELTQTAFDRITLGEHHRVCWERGGDTLSYPL